MVDKASHETRPQHSHRFMKASSCTICRQSHQVVSSPQQPAAACVPLGRDLVNVKISGVTRTLSVLLLPSISVRKWQLYNRIPPYLWFLTHRRRERERTWNIIEIHKVTWPGKKPDRDVLFRNSFPEWVAHREDIITIIPSRVKVQLWYQPVHNLFVYL